MSPPSFTATKFHGPFVIKRVLSPVVFELAELSGESIGKVHVKDLKSYNTSFDP